MIIIVDNYDSFTYNLFQYVKEYYSNVKVIKNDNINLLDLDCKKVKALIFSPGPGKPSEAGLMPKIIKKYYSKIPILGICLGHQSIIETFGGSIVNADEICHGKVHKMKHFSNCVIFDNISNNFEATRYHSLVSCHLIPDCLEVTAVTNKNHKIMGIQHKKYQVFGLQFHPESIETKNGMKMIKNFINVI